MQRCCMDENCPVSLHMQKPASKLRIDEVNPDGRYRKPEVCERFILVPLRWNTEVFALAVSTQTSALGEKKRDTRPKHPLSLPSNPLNTASLKPSAINTSFLSPTRAMCFLNQGRLLLFSHIPRQTELIQRGGTFTDETPLPCLHPEQRGL